MKAKEDQGQTGGRSPPFVCRIARFAHSSSSLSSYLALLAPGDLAYPAGSFVPLPPLFIPYSLTFVWQASTQKMTAPLLSLHRTTSSLPTVYLFTPCTFSGRSAPLYPLYFPLFRSLSLKMVAADERSCALSVDLDTSRSLGLLSYMHFTSAGLYLCRTSVTDMVTMATVSKDH